MFANHATSKLFQYASNVLPMYKGSGCVLDILLQIQESLHWWDITCGSRGFFLC